MLIGRGGARLCLSLLLPKTPKTFFVVHVVAREYLDVGDSFGVGRGSALAGGL